MLKLKNSPKPLSATIPAGVTTLSVSWLNNQFKALAVHKGVVEGTWEHPGEVEGTGNFDALIREAVQKTGYHGQTISLLMAHPRLAQQLVDVPPVKGSALDKVVQRQAQQQKMFDGEAAYAYQPAVSGKAAQRVILHLFPKPLLNQLVQGGQKNNLHLTQVTPPTAVVHGQLTQLPLEKDEITLLAAETGGGTTLVVGRADGQVLLARTLTGNWNDGAERLAVDLNRTILFVNQQFGVSIGSVWMFGSGAKDQLAKMQGLMQLPVKLSPVESKPVYWATEVLKLPEEGAPNFISVQLQKAPQRRMLFKVVAMLAVLVMIISLIATLYLNFLARQQEYVKQRLTEKAAELQQKHKELQQLNADLASKQDMVKLVMDDRAAPVPGWFLGYLSEAVPNELVVTNLHVKREEDLWKVQLGGTLQTTVKQPAPAVLSNSVAVLASKLANGPFHVQLLDGTEKAKETAAGKSKGSTNTLAGFVARLTSSPQARPLTDNQANFMIEGVMR